MPPTAAPPPAVLEHIALEHLVPNPRNPRHLPSVDKDAELVLSVGQEGILEPLLVRQIDAGKHQHHLFEIVAGHRRHHAATIVKLATVPCMVRMLTDQQVLEHALIENLQRADLHPLDEAAAIAALLEMDRDATITTVADRIGKSVGAVNRSLSLTRLAPPARKLFLAEKMRLRGAYALARLQPNDQLACLKDRGGVGRDAGISERDITHWIEQHVILNLAEAPFRLDDETLDPTAGSCVACPKRTGNAPGLFEDVKNTDTCTDPACFRQKVALFIGAKKAELTAEPKAGDALLGVVLIAETAYSSGPQDRALKTQGILTKGDGYVDAPSGTCDHVRRGLVAFRQHDAHASNKLAPLGAVKRVCIAPLKCKVHKAKVEDPYARTPKSAAQKATEKKRTQAVAEFMRVTAVKVRRLVATVLPPLKPADLRFVVRASWDRALYDGQKALVKALGWDIKSFTTSEKYLEKQLAAVPDAALLSLLVVIALADELQPPHKYGAQTLKTPELDRLLKVFKVKLAPADFALPVQGGAAVAADRKAIRFAAKKGGR